MKATANLNWNLWVKCPQCGYETDLSDADDDGVYSRPIFSNKWDDLKGEEVECMHCGEVFEIEEVVY